MLLKIQFLKFKFKFFICRALLNSRAVVQAAVSRSGLMGQKMRSFWGLRDSNKKTRDLTNASLRMSMENLYTTSTFTSLVNPNKKLRIKIDNTFINIWNVKIPVEGGMDFRAMLMRRKKPAKKVVVVSLINWDKI